jgi:hypothetical protein
MQSAITLSHRVPLPCEKCTFRGHFLPRNNGWTIRDLQEKSQAVESRQGFAEHIYLGRGKQAPVCITPLAT